jgi:hypothetical protein
MRARTDSRGGESEVTERDVLYGDRRDQHYVAIRTTTDGITLRRRDTEYYVPHAIFAEWYDPARVTRNEGTPVERPDWIDPE